MAPKRSTPLDDPPSASSDDEETEDEQEHIIQKTNEESSSEEEEEEEEEEDSEEETIDLGKNPIEKAKIRNPNSKTAELSSEEESESESEEEIATPVKTSVEKPKIVTPKSSSAFDFDTDPDLRSPTASDFAIKPSKKINISETPEKTPMSKRPFSGTDIKDKKKIKVSNGDVDDEKKSVIKRVWSDDDELLLLQGFIDYQSKKGCSPLSDMDGFYQFTMGSLPGNASKSQLYEKVRRLKKKFRVNSEKVSGNGEDPVFSKPHERKLFELSKKIWGIGGCESVSGGGASNSKSKTKAKPKMEVKEEEDDGTMAKIVDFETLYPYWSAGLNSEVVSSLKFPEGVAAVIKENLSLIGEAKAKEMDEKWKALFDNESMLRRARISLLGNIANL